MFIYGDIASEVVGYDKDYYEKITPVIPRVYHEHLSEEQLENLYTESEINNLYNKAYFVSNPDRFRSNGFKGAVCSYIDICNSGQRLINGSQTENTVMKKMKIKNVGEGKAFVRLFIAIPTILDDPNPTNNLLHFNTKAVEGLAEGKWNFGKAMDRPAGQYVGPSGWNTYNTVIDGIAYTVYVGTHETAIDPGEITVDAIYQVYLDATATAEDIISVNKTFKTNQWQLLSVAEAVAVDEESEEDCFAAFDSVYTDVEAHDPFNNN